MNEITVKIQKLVNGGQGLGFYNEKPVFAWNALPEETAVIKVTKNKGGLFEGIVARLIDASAERIEPEEDHFLSCSPWQIMTFACENRWKKAIAKETFQRLGGIELPDFDIVFNQNKFGYRNKIEYSFYPDDGNNELRLAFHERGTTRLHPIDRCLLAKAEINEAATEILSRLNTAARRTGSLKSLILRENGHRQVVASLIVTDKNFRLPDSVVGNDILAGFHIYFSGSSAGVPGVPKLLQSWGDTFFTEEIGDRKFKCSPLSFFQINIGVFEKAITRIGTFVEKEDEIVDFYSGVGAIGITLADKAKNCILIEGNEESAKLAGENIKENGLNKTRVFAGNAEHMRDKIKKDTTIVFDPPRAGLHPKVVDRVLEILPRKIIYLSCDIATQARDTKLLSRHYALSFCEIYNFFPRTPHIESLLIFERK